MNVINLNARRGEATRQRVADALADRRQGRRDRRAKFLTRLAIFAYLSAWAWLFWWWLP